MPGTVTNDPSCGDVFAVRLAAPSNDRTDQDPQRFSDDDPSYAGEFRCLGCGGPDDGHCPACLDILAEDPMMFER